jgi:hypothetical protein
VAIGLAILLREICRDVQIHAFNTSVMVVPPRRGFALRDAIRKELGGGTQMWEAIRTAGQKRHNDIMVVITDEQTVDRGDFHDSNAGLLVVINVASNENGVGYGKSVLHIDGWSDNAITYLREYIKTNI